MHNAATTAAAAATSSVLNPRIRSYDQKLTEKEQNRLNRNNYELGLELNIQPLVQVDPTVLNSSRSPLKNPRPGDYMLNKVASTEGIASKKSLELKARYLLGEPPAHSTGIMKSDSTSVLDSKFRTFRSNITECQKLLTSSTASAKAAAQVEMEEKDETYGQIDTLTRPEEKKPLVGAPITETVNVKLIENKLKVSSQPQSVSLSSATNSSTITKTTSSNNGSSTPIAADLTEEILKSNDEYIRKLGDEIKEARVVDTIDLTGDSPDEYADKTITREVKRESAKENGKKEKSMEEPQVTRKWEEQSKKQEEEEVESDSLSETSSSSSHSSVHDIPHFILDSTTSPDTQNVHTPVLSAQSRPKDVKSLGDQLMQIDSLMIVDGKYVGDVEDLQLLEKLPEGTIVEEREKQQNGRKTDSANLDYLNKNRPTLKFDTKNENKVDTLKNIPISIRPLNRLDSKKSEEQASDSEETDLTGQVFTETELSDWAADDAVSENFVDLEFALNSNKGTIKRNKKAAKKKKTDLNASPRKEVLPQVQGRAKDPLAAEKRSETCSIMKNLGVENIEFMDTGSDESCAETYSTTNKAMLKNRGYVEFVENGHQQQQQQNSPLYRNTSSVSLQQNKLANYDTNKEDPLKEIPGIDFVEQGACILTSDYNELKTPVNEIPRMDFPSLSLKFSGMNRNSAESLDDIEQDSLLIVDNVREMPVVVGTRRDNDRTPQNDLPKTFGEGHDKERSGLRKSQERLFDDPARPNEDDMTYEEYVRQLQNKITQISNARDSLEVKKARRKSSKGDLSVNGVEIVLDASMSGNCSRPLSIFDQGIVTQPPTLTKKLEELTKERAKQKDLIHDLVMDKLQTKKQLNAEKRLNRSRNRQIGAMSPGLPLSPISRCSPIPPPLPPKATDDEDGVKRLDPGLEIGRRGVFDRSPPVKENGATSNVLNKENLPLNENLNNSTSPKIGKTQSFCVYPSRLKAPSTPATAVAYHVDDNYIFATPVRDSHPAPGGDPGTEKLRTEARARALLKTNEELGLSPEEKILQLRRKYHLEKQQQQSPYLDMLGTNKSDDVKAKEKFMMASKSVNDVRNEKVSLSVVDKGSTSDPNLLESKTATEGTVVADAPKRRGGRHKDPERRKSLIQAVSDFFHKRKEGGASPSATGNSNSTSNSTTTTTPNGAKEKMDTLFNRFKISPKSKDKTKVRNWGEIIYWLVLLRV